jgi:signal transduction histidine kinase
MGLLGMQERAEMFGGRLEITSHPGKGTHIKVWLPTDGGGEMPNADSGAHR